jgi:hypothetical protein
VYLHGSLAMGCFNPARSDLDVLVVCKTPTSRPVKSAFARALLHVSKTPRPVEISVLALEHLHPWRYPTPYDWHYSETHRRTFQAKVMPSIYAEGAPTPKDYDLAAHITILHHYGVVLHGAPIAETFPAVPPEDYRDSILRDAEQARLTILDTPVYSVLNLCRVYAYLREGLILSKDQGGQWAYKQLPDEHHALILWALASYRGGELDHTITGALDEAILRFAAYKPEHYPL